MPVAVHPHGEHAIVPCTTGLISMPFCLESAHQYAFRVLSKLRSRRCGERARERQGDADDKRGTEGVEGGQIAYMGGGEEGGSATPVQWGE